MKKIELNEIGRVVMIILIWLLSFTVVTNAATITGTAFIGAFTFYVGALFLTFFYFKDERLMKNAKMSLIVVVVFAIAFIAIQCYTEILVAFNVDQLNDKGDVTAAYKIADILNGIVVIFKNVVMVICLLVTVLNALRTGDNKILDLDEPTKKEEKSDEKKTVAKTTKTVTNEQNKE